ncbi:MAG: hypothetical protein ACSHYF_03210 [Verrucomicrobiaceae bacterium]
MKIFNLTITGFLALILVGAGQSVDEKVPLKDLPVVREKVVEQGGRRIFFQEVNLPSVDQKRRAKGRGGLMSRSGTLPWWKIPTTEVEKRHYQVTATVYDERITLLSWRSTEPGEDGVFSCWSNVNWKELVGLDEVAGPNYEFSFFLFVSEARGAQMGREGKMSDGVEVPNLPDLEKGGARYLLTAGNRDDEAGIEFMETLHALHDGQKQHLRAAHRARKIAELYRSREIKRGSPQPKAEDVVIRFRQVSAEEVKEIQVKRGR